MEKKFLFIVLYLMTSIALWSQPVITANDVRPAIGDKFIGFFYNVDTLDYPAGSAGANVTWDFSGLKDSLPNDLQAFFDTLSENPGLVYEVVAPAGLLFADSFPNTDFVIRNEINFFGTFLSNTFINETPNGFFSLGDVSITAFDFLGMMLRDTSVTVNASPEVFLPMPLTFGVKASSSTMVVEEDITGFFIDEITETDSSVVDGYGTLITPWKTYTDVLRVT